MFPDSLLLWQGFNLHGTPDGPLEGESEAKEHGHPNQHPSFRRQDCDLPVTTIPHDSGCEHIDGDLAPITERRARRPCKGEAQCPNERGG